MSWINRSDESTSHLDRDTVRKLLEFVKERNKNRCTYILITHNPDLVETCARVLVLEKNGIVEIVNNAQYSGFKSIL